MGAVVLSAAAHGCGAAGQRDGGERVDQAPGWIAPELAARAVDFRGSCSWGRHPGQAERYRVALRTLISPSASIPVYADARLGGAGGSNLLGELPSGVSVLAEGPLASGGGVGYALIVRGHAGRLCRGYVSAASLAPEQRLGATDKADAAALGHTGARPPTQ
ncbi:hypothetical protein [Haliangium ochraceum]|uniref:hypothetical protein n=1 Tax=Haliangium ochraceum TaxID=80816 RepID=UPI0003232EC7|nr:hypothetical protein [Haliangium ochraceum]